MNAVWDAARTGGGTETVAIARTGAEPLVAAQGLSVDLGGQRVLDGVDLTIRPAEIVTIVGPNGSGKTTLVRAIVGLLRPAAGRLVRAPGLRLGYVPQRLAVDGSLPMTVARFMDLPRRRGRAAVEAALAGAGLPGLGGRQLAALSGGQLQRVLLARALMDRPNLLILDEATAGLDQPATAAFYARIEAVRAREGCAVLMVSHDLQVVMRASDHVVCLNRHVCCEGTPEAVSASAIYRGLFGGDEGTMALYRHHHTHSHDDASNEGPGQGHDRSRDRGPGTTNVPGCGADHGHDHPVERSHFPGSESPLDAPGHPSSHSHDHRTGHRHHCCAHDHRAGDAA